MFDIDADTVFDNWGKTMPALVARFAPMCETAPATSFAAIQMVIFNGKGCSSGGCHAGSRPAGSMNLSSGSAYDAIVNITAQGGGGLKRVLPGDAESSYLYRKVSARTNPGSFSINGSPMPLAGSALSADQLAALSLWIEAGATESGRADEMNEVERLLGLCNPRFLQVKCSRFSGCHDPNKKNGMTIIPFPAPPRFSRGPPARQAAPRPGPAPHRERPRD